MEVRDDEAMINSFRRGVESMRILSNSNIEGVVRLIDASELPPSIIMEYVDGIDLQRFVNENHLNDADSKLKICLWIAQIIFGCHSHEQIILHRDLRPSNIMITGEYWSNINKENIKILDFDLSWFKGASGAEFYMNASQALGFLAPEQLDVKSKFSTRSALVDVYGIGMLLYFVISKEIPLASASARNDWSERVRRASSNVYNRNWHSTKQIFIDLISSCTNEIQEKRPQLQNVIEKLTTLIDIFNQKYPFNCDSCIMEIMIRISGGHNDIKYDYNHRTATYVSGAGVSVELSAVGENIKCSIKYTMGESANRNARGKTLIQGLFRAKSKVERFSKIEKDSATEIGANILKFEFQSPSNLKDLDEIATGIQFAITEIAREY